MLGLLEFLVSAAVSAVIDTRRYHRSDTWQPWSERSDAGLPIVLELSGIGQLEFIFDTSARQ